MAEIEDVSRTWRSSLSSEELADAFRQSATAASRLSLLDRSSAFMWRSINERSVTSAKSFGDLRNALEFFTPDSSGPFARFGAQADFSVGASIPQKDGNPLPAHLELHEEGDTRRITLRVLYIASFGHTRARRNLAEKTMRELQEGMAAREPATRQTRTESRTGHASEVQALPSSSRSAALGSETGVRQAESDSSDAEVRLGRSPAPLLDASEENFRAADAAGDALAARQLGEALEKRGEIDAAEAAYRRAESRGNERATMLLGLLLEDHLKDLAGAERAYRRADARGDLNGAGNLGRLLRDRGQLREAEAAFKRCANRGSVRAIGDVVGLMLQRTDVSQDEMAELTNILCSIQDKFFLKNDTDAAAAVVGIDTIEERFPAAFAAGTARADERGSAAGAWHVAWTLRREGRRADAVAAFRRSIDRGHAEASEDLAPLHIDMGDLAAAEAVAREGDQAGVGRASFLLGWLLDKRGDEDGALKAFERGDAAGEADGSLHLGLVLMRRGELGAAEGPLERAVQGGAESAERPLAHVQSRLDRYSSG